MKTRLNYIMWYHGLFGSSKRAKKALDFYGGFEKLYEVVKNDADTEGLLKNFHRTRLTSYSLLDASETIEMCRDMGCNVISFESEYYPTQLLGISDFPKILFYQGDREVLKDEVFVSVVGSRDAPHEALSLTFNAANDMAKAGAVIVSGAAIGIDIAAHKGAVAAGGATVGVLGCGLGNEYMKRLGSFYDEVCASGVFITEMMPFAAPSKYSFPERNRIISGMSHAVLVSCAGEKSGALITAQTAKKQKRKVYAVPPDIYPTAGCERLISEGAEALHRTGDILLPLKEFFTKPFNDEYCDNEIAVTDVPKEAYSVTAEEKVKQAPKKKPAKEASLKTEKAKRKEKISENKAKAAETKKELPDYVSDEARRVYLSLSDTKTDINSLVPLTGMPVQTVLSAISELELFGFVKNLPGAMVEKI